MSVFYALRHTLAPAPAQEASSEPKELLPQEILHAWPATFAANSVTGNPRKAPLEGLQVGGLVSSPRQWTLSDLMKLPRVNQIRRIVSADGWSIKGHWEGVSLRYLLDLVQPLPSARFLKQENALGHVEYLSLQDILKGDYLLAHHENEQPLSALYGGPLWLLVFDRYTYKGLSQINRLTLCEALQQPSSSQTRGYSENGLWEPGSKTYAIDLKAYKTLDRPGQEIKMF